MDIKISNELLRSFLKNNSIIISLDDTNNKRNEDNTEHLRVNIINSETNLDLDKGNISVMALGFKNESVDFNTLGKVISGEINKILREK